MKELAQDENNYKDEIEPPVDASDRCAIEQSRKSALLEAASFDDTEIVNFMLDCGAMINLRNDDRGETASVKASWDGHDEVVQTLLESGALVNKTDIWGRTARMLLDRRADYDCICKYHGTPMIDAIGNDDDKIVKLLLDNSAAIEMAEKNAGSPLRAAAVRGHQPIVRLLIEHGADLNKESPLIEALRRGHKDVVKLLVEKGANVNAVQGIYLKDGMPFWLYTLPTTRCLAQIMSSLLGISKLCLRPKKRDPNKRQEYLWEKSPLWVAAALGDMESVKLLPHHGAKR